MIEDITLKSCLEFAVKTEEVGSQFYSRLAGKFTKSEAPRSKLRGIWVTQT